MRAVIVVGIAAALAYVPVVLVATRFGVVGTGSAISRPIAVLGVHGFDLRVALGLVSNSVSYAIAATGPGALDMILGGVGFVLCASVFVPRWSTRVWALPLRIAVVLWLFGWLPVGHLILPIQQVFVADRYLLIPTLGAALALATGITRLRGKTLVGCALVIAFAIRALDAQSSWASNVALWQRAVTSSPTDGNAWSMLVEALDADGRTAEASDAVETAFTHTRAPRLVMHAGLTALAEHRTDQAFAFMTEAAVGGEPRAMANLANMLAGTNHLQPALLWARLAVAIAPGYANGHRIHGKIARLIDQHSVESLDAFARAYVIEPDNAMNRYNYGIALVDAGRRDEGKTLLESCVDDPQVGRYARVALQHV